MCIIQVNTVYISFKVSLTWSPLLAASLLILVSHRVGVGVGLVVAVADHSSWSYPTQQLLYTQGDYNFSPDKDCHTIEISCYLMVKNYCYEQFHLQ